MTEPRYRGVDETQLSQELFNQVLCPNMRTGIRMSLLNPDSEGWVSVDELRAYLQYIGVGAKSKVEGLLISTGEKAPEIKKPNHINLSAFKGTFLDHGSSSGILNNPEGFLQDRLDLLKSFANAEGRLYKNDLGRAMNNFYQCPFHTKSLLGTNVLAFEFAGLVEIYGRDDKENGEKYFTLEDIDSLWKYNRFPDGWQAPKTTFYGTGPAFFNYVGMMIRRIKIGWKTI